MHLDREFIGSENEFNQQREFFYRSAAFPLPVRWQLPPGVFQFLAFKRTRRDPALLVRQPYLADGLRQILLVGVNGRERTFSPNPRLKRRVNAKRGDLHKLSRGLCPRKKLV